VAENGRKWQARERTVVAPRDVSAWPEATLRKCPHAEREVSYTLALEAHFEATIARLAAFFGVSPSVFSFDGDLTGGHGDH
jgi:hypothetical protein